MKMFLCSLSVICFSIDGMVARAHVARTRMPRPSRSYYTDWRLHLPPFKVVSKPHLAPEVHNAVQAMNDAQKFKFRELHATMQFHAIEGTLQTAAATLATLNHIERSSVLDQVDENGRTLLIKAAKIGYHNFMRFLLHYDANAAVADNDGLTALSINPTVLTQQVVQGLLHNNVDVTTTDRLGRQALHYLALRPEVDGVEFGETAYFDEFSIYERTNAKVARLLIPEGANMLARDKKGKTPIDFAIWSNHQEMLKVFIECGADADAIRKAAAKIKMEQTIY